MTCMIVDDEYLAIKILEDYASRIPALTVERTFTKPQEALSYLIKKPAELLFLDIQMPQFNGFELLKKLTELPMIVFTTARHDYAVHAFDLDVLDYLVKPISFERFEKAVKKAAEYKRFKTLSARQSANENYLMIKADHRIHKIMTDQVEYIEGLGEYVKIHTPGKTFITLAALKDLYSQLPPDQFVRVHKSFIVSISSIASFNHQQVCLKSGDMLPVGRLYKADFLKKMNT
jgi:two-component system response regulator LytT